MKIKIFFTILLLYVVTLANCADVKDEKMDVSNSYNQDDSKFIIVTSLILFSIDLLACLYILVRTFLRWKQCKKFPMPMNLLFPFYIALIGKESNINYEPNDSFSFRRIYMTLYLFIYLFLEFVISILQIINWVSK